MFTLDGSAANVALPTLAQAFDASLATVQWVVVAYLLALTTLVLAAARLGDRMGRKRAYLAGLAIFAIGAVACGLAPSIRALIAARAVQGVGAVFLSALSGAIVAQTFPPEERGRALGVVAALVFGGLALGPTAGGFLLGAFGWRGVFLATVPIALLALAVVACVIPDLPAMPRRRAFDWIGALTLAASLAALALGLTFAQSQGLGAPGVLALIVAAVAGAVVFVVLQKRVRVPLVDLRLLHRPTIGLGLALALLVYLTLSGTTLLLPFYLATVMHYGPAKMGLLMAAAPLLGMLTAPLGGALADRVGPRRLTLVATSALVLGCAALATLDPAEGEWGYVLRTLPFGLAIGLFNTANNSAVLNAARPEELGIVSGLLSLARTLGQSAGVPLLGAAFAAIALRQTGVDPNALLALPESQLAHAMRLAFAGTIVLALGNVAIAARLLRLKRQRGAVMIEDHVR
jgi:EmrB/QacA subfamily drug resistance transporter